MKLHDVETSILWYYISLKCKLEWQPHKAPKQEEVLKCRYTQHIMNPTYLQCLCRVPGSLVWGANVTHQIIHKQVTTFRPATEAQFLEPVEHCLFLVSPTTRTILVERETLF